MEVGWETGRRRRERGQKGAEDGEREGSDEFGVDVVEFFGWAEVSW